MLLPAPWLVVVARVGAGAKSRLAAVLPPASRRQLALGMLADVLTTCRAALPDGAALVAVVDDPGARELAAALGARLADDPGTGDMNAAARAGIAAAIAGGATSVIVLPGDIPLLEPADLDALRAAAGTGIRAVVVGESRDGHGTNALLLRPPTVIEPSFGPPSVPRHLAAGRAADAHSVAVPALGLAHDVDTPADLADLVDLADPRLGPGTAAVLADLTARQPRPA